MRRKPLVSTNKDLTENQKRDYREFYIEKGDVGFSPERNKEIIEGTIKKYEANQLRKKKLYSEQIHERVDAVMSYLNSRMARGISPVEQYFGKKTLAYLRGQKIMKELQGNSFILSSTD